MRATITFLVLCGLMSACGHKYSKTSPRPDQNPGISLVGEMPSNFNEIPDETLARGEKIIISDEKTLPLGWRFSVPRKGLLTAVDLVTSRTCDGEPKLSSVIRRFKDDGALAPEVLTDLGVKPVDLESGKYALVISKNAAVNCSKLSISFVLKLALPQDLPNSNASDNSTPRTVIFEHFEYIQEIAGSSNAPDTGALFIVRANSGNIKPESIMGPSFLNEVSIDQVSQTSVEKLFGYSTVQPSQSWQAEVLNKYNNGTLLYFKKYQSSLCDDEQHEVKVAFHTPGYSHTAIWSFSAVRQPQGPCTFHIDSFLVQSLNQ